VPIGHISPIPVNVKQQSTYGATDNRFQLVRRF